MSKILNLFRWKRRRLERDLERELRYHVDRRVEDMMKAGASEAAARRQVAIEFGGVVQVREDVRDVWIYRWLDALAGDIRYAIRSLTKSWSFTLGAGVVLALGIGANTAIFSVVHKVLLQPLAYPDAERIVSVEALWTNTGRTGPEVSGPDFLDWQAETGVFEMLAHWSGEDDVATVVDGHAEFSNFRFVSPDFFAVFGLAPSAGRLWPREVLSSDDGPTVAVVSHHWAETHFGSAEAAIGKPIRVYGMTMEIVGVAAPGFRYPDKTNIWAPDRATSRTNRGAESYNVVGKIRAGVDVGAAQVQMRTVGDALARQYPENRDKTVAVTSLQQRLTGDVRGTLWVLMGAVSVVLLIACANIANLLLARSVVRAREIALRAALGAGRGRVVRQLLTESLVLAGLAATAGVLFAHVLLRGLVALSPADLPRVDEAQVDLTVLLFALAVSLAATLVFGLVPAMSASRLDLSDALKQGGSKGAVSGTSGRLRATLVVTEVALSVMLLAAAGLLLRSFQVLHSVDLGFTTERVVVAYTQYVASSAELRKRRITFYQDFLERLRAAPGVNAASGASFLPMGREPMPAVSYVIQGRPEERPGERPRAEFQAITPGYFKTLQIPIRRGRDFDESDAAERPLVAIINESLARAAFPTESPIGQRIKNQRSSQWYEIVGVVADTRWRDPSKTPPSALYLSSLQGAGGSLSILARTSLDQESLARTLRALLNEADPTVPARLETMDELFAGALAYPRFRTQLIGAFAGIAALLAAVGVFSLLAYLVGQRTRELAVRRALGAQGGDVIRLIVGHGLRLVAIGLVLGLVGALAIARLLEGLLYEISPWDPATYLGVVAVLGLSATLAILLPAVRAATIDPLIALRHE